VVGSVGGSCLRLGNHGCIMEGPWREELGALLVIVLPPLAALSSHRPVKAGMGLSECCMWPWGSVTYGAPWLSWPIRVGRVSAFVQ
jgi:hypothetical protein